MSEYSTTPNLGLFKPNYNKDWDSWGDHLNLNADKLDQAFGGSASGPFLPLSGVAPMTGPLTLAGDAMAPLHAVPLQQLDAAFADGPFLSLTGGDMQGPLNYVATGGTTVRSAQDRAADTINAQDYGAIGTGDANIDTATILAAVAALPENGGVLRIGSRNVQGVSLNQTITITKSCKIEGVTTNGWCSSIVCQMSGPAFVFSDPTPTYQKTFEIENVRFVANNPTGPTAAAIRVSIGPTPSQVYPSFIARNIDTVPNTVSAAAPYARTFTNGIEFLPPSNPGTGGVHNFWNIVLENITHIGVTDTATGLPIVGTAGIKFGHLIYAKFNNVNVSTVASGFRQTDYCEGITCLSCQLFTCTNGWDQSAFAPVGASAVKLLQPVMLGCMINALQSALVLDCVYIGQFSNCYITGAGAINIAMTNAQATHIASNSIVNGTTGVSMTRAGFNEGGNIIQANNFANQTTHILLGPSTFDTLLDNQQANGSALVIVNNGGDGNKIRSSDGPLMLGSSLSADTEVKLLGASGAWRALSIWTGTSAFAGQRWALGTGTTAESGGNSGSNFQIATYDDTGNPIATPLTISRATSEVVMRGPSVVVGNAPSTDSELKILGASGGTRAMTLWTGTTASAGLRWIVGTQANAESGGNAGSDFRIQAFGDTGAPIGTPIEIIRSTGGVRLWNGFGVFNQVPVTSRPAVTGSKGANAALASLLTALASYGLVTDSST